LPSALATLTALMIWLGAKYPLISDTEQRTRLVK